MEPTINRPLIVELVGLPGAGKTTVVNELVQRLNMDGMVAVNVSSVLSKYQTHILQKTLLTACGLFLHPFVVFYVLRLWLHTSSAKKSSFRTVLYFLRLYYLLGSKKFQNEISAYNYAIADQFILQGIASVVIPCKCLPPSRNFEALTRLTSNRIGLAVRVDCSESLSLERLRKRNNCRTRFDGWGDMENKKNLNDMKNVLSLLMSKFGCLSETFSVNAIDAVEDKVVKIIERLG